jgi:hypothetical protein
MSLKFQERSELKFKSRIIPEAKRGGGNSTKTLMTLADSEPS